MHLQKGCRVMSQMRVRRRHQHAPLAAHKESDLILPQKKGDGWSAIGRAWIAPELLGKRLRRGGRGATMTSKKRERANSKALKKGCSRGEGARNSLRLSSAISIAPDNSMGARYSRA
jgi:hypothetical protein